MLPPVKEFLTISQEEMFSLLRAKCKGDLFSLTPDIIKEILQPFIGYGFDLPDELNLEQTIEREFNDLDDEPITVIKNFFHYMEEINATFKPYSPCKKGCSKCCLIPVLVSCLEVNLIELYLISIEHTNTYRRKEKINNDLSRQNKESIIGEEYTGIMCPFLKNGECVIYIARPYVCRRYITFEDDNTKCGHDNGNIILFKSPIIDSAYEKIIKYYYQKNNPPNSIYEMFGDIRDFFSSIM